MTREEKALKAWSMVKGIIRDTVAESGAMGAPSGHIYAALMSAGVSLDIYQKMVSELKAEGAIRESSHTLYAIEKEAAT